MKTNFHVLMSALLLVGAMLSVGPASAGTTIGSDEIVFVDSDHSYSYMVTAMVETQSEFLTNVASAVNIDDIRMNLVSMNIGVDLVDMVKEGARGHPIMDPGEFYFNEYNSIESLLAINQDCFITPDKVERHRLPRDGLSC